MRHGMRRVLPLYIGLVLVVSVLAGCGEPTPRPMSAQNPLYLLVVNDQQLQLDVINRPSYQLAGAMALGSVGSTPPNGAVGVFSADSAVVTHTAAFENGTETVKAGTLLCRLGSGACQTLLDDWGSATVNVAAQQVAVPVWHGVNPTHGELALLSQASSKVTSRLHLPNLLPGPMQVGPDGRSLYWITSKTEPNGTSAYELDRIDLASQRVTATYSFGQSVPSDLMIGPDGSIYVSMLFAQAQGSGEVAVFQPDLTPAGAFNVGQVGQNPSAVAVSAANGGSLAVIYSASGDASEIDVYSLASHALVRRIAAPDLSAISYVSTLANGDFAAVGALQGRTIVGVFSRNDTQAKWNNFSGTPIAAAAG